MSSQKHFVSLKNPLNSLFVKCTLMVIVCVVSVVATITMNSSRFKETMASDALSARAAEVTGLMANQLGGAVKFSNEAAISDVVTGVIDGARPDAVGAYLLSGNGSVLYDSLGEVEDAQIVAELAATAAETGTVVISDDGMIASFPILFGDAGETVGSLVTQWDQTNKIAALSAVQTEGLLLGGVVMLVGLVLSILFLLTQMSRPLLRIEAAMGAVADENYDVDVPFTARKDEIGKMARRLDTFRIALAEAKEAERESAFKSAAFGGSGASMMMVDEDLKVIFVNPSCAVFLKDLQHEMETHWRGFEAGDPIGANLVDFGPLMQLLKQVMEQGEDALPIKVSVKLGDALVKVSINAAHNATGGMIGAVLQWSDRTEATRNAALLEAIDKNQLRVEFDATGAIENGNDNFLNLVGLSTAQLCEMSLGNLFKNNAEDDASRCDVLQKLNAQEPVFGQFQVCASGNSQCFTVDGSFAAVTTPEGTLERAIFLGADVTQTAEAIKNAEILRQRVALEQQTTVDALGVALKKLAEGDLSGEITSAFPDDYEQLREDFNLALTSLQDAVAAVVNNTESIRNETKEITTAADDLSRRTEKQAATLEETAAALDELTSSVKSAAQGADEAAELSSAAQLNAEEGGDVAKLAVTAMDGIKNASEEVSKITSVIDDIAFQTNLLALNAGVEAARAGEAGRGFAVVATEVRALAQRSSDAAKEINALISSSERQVQEGVELVNRTGDALSEIVTSVSEISQRIATIAGSAREQSVGLNEINSAVNDLDHVTQQNAAMFEETTAASHALTSEADALAGAVSRFNLGVARQTVPSTNNKPAAAGAAAVAHGNLALKQNDAPRIETGWEEF